jgi:peptidoglycan hydrolase-like protein with peptidoglycan-binding domain
MTSLRVDKMTADINGPEPPSPSSGRRRWWIGGAAVVAAAAATVWVATGGNGGDAPTGDIADSFAEVALTDLTATEEYSGTLGRSAGDPVLARSPGTITSTAAAGETLVQGDVLFDVDGEPVVLFLGDLPAFRTMAPEPETTTVVARSPGTLTAAAADDSLLTQGDVAFAIDGKPTVLLFGETPAYRTLSTNAEDGPDITQLETALVALGYDPDGTVTVDDEFTASTANMVERWQADIGVADTGVVALGDVVFLPSAITVESVIADVGTSVGNGQGILAVGVGEGDLSGDDVAQLEAALAALGYDPGDVDGTFDADTVAAVVAWQSDIGAEPDGIIDLGEVVFRDSPIRVTEVLAVPGAPVNAGTPVLATSSADTAVSLDLPAADQGTLEVGDAVTVILPDNTRTPATVTSVGTVASQVQGGDATFEVVVTLDDPAAAAGLDEAPVDVEVVTESRRGVIAVPVTALLALAEGGYAVEVEQPDGTTRLVAVEPGFYSSGLVEIVSGSVEPGDRVVVP